MKIIDNRVVCSGGEQGFEVGQNFYAVLKKAVPVISLLGGEKRHVPATRFAELIDKEEGREAALDSISKAFTLGSIYLSRKGYTISIQDLNVSEKVKKLTAEVVAQAEKKTLEIIKQYKMLRKYIKANYRKTKLSLRIKFSNLILKF